MFSLDYQPFSEVVGGRRDSSHFTDKKLEAQKG